MNLEVEYRERALNTLNEKSFSLIEYFSERIDEGTLASVLDFEFHIDSVSDSMPIVCRTSVSPFENQCLIESEIFSDEKYQSIESSVWQMTTNIIFEWFQSCWLSAGGEYYKGNAYLMEHDSLISLNLKSGAWIENDQRVDW